MVSHSNAYALCPVFRNLKDEQIDAVGKNGGVIQLNFYSAFVDSTFKNREKIFLQNKQAEIKELIAKGMQKEYAQTMVVEKYKEESLAIQPPMSMLLDHLDYIVKRIGVDHVGMGSDFDGISQNLEMKNASYLPQLEQALKDAGLTTEEIEKVFYKNVLRVYREILK